MKRWKVTIVEMMAADCSAFVEAETEQEARELGVQEIDAVGVFDNAGYVNPRQIYVEEFSEEEHDEWPHDE